MRRSTFVILGVLAFVAILGTFVVRGTTRLVIGEQASLLLATPLALLSLALVLVLLVIAAGDFFGIVELEDGSDR